MNTDDAIRYIGDDRVPAAGAIVNVAPGVAWLRMTLPFALDHINLWLLEDEIETPAGRMRGWTVIDCGIASDLTRQHWESIFHDQLQGLPILRVLVTHCHPDHVGAAGWLCRRWQAPLWMSAGEYGFARLLAAGLPGTDSEALVQHFQAHGLSDTAQIAALRQRKDYYRNLVSDLPLSYHRLQDHQLLRIGACDWRVIIGHGHAPEHVSLYAEDLHVLISGDMVLPRISTNVSVLAIEPEANPVQQYLASLHKYKDLAADTLVLPSHGKPFHGLHARIAQLNQHHGARLAEVLQACATPRSAADIVPLMFKRPLDMHQLGFAFGEALAHLHKLWFDGALKREYGADRVYRFVAVI